MIMVLKIAMVTPQTIMVFILFPSQTIKNWCQSCLWQAVQDNEIGLENIGGTVTPPEQHGDKGAENQNKDKADKGFADGNADMIKETFVSCHLHHYFQNPRWAAENKIVNQMAPGGNFPSA